MPDPDRAVISHLNYLTQLTTSQIRRLVFPTSKSRTTSQRVLTRLENEKYIRRVERMRNKGGSRGGTGETVWMLGKNGWTLCSNPGRFSAQYQVNYHTLTIADIFVKLREDERAGKYKLTGWTPEPESWITIDGVDLRPDLLVQLTSDHGVLNCYIEADMGTQRPARINEKLSRYTRAYAAATSEQLPELPRVVFVTHSEERRDELNWIIRRSGNENRYFFAATVVDFPDDMR